jgi:hypothetical protein
MEQAAARARGRYYVLRMVTVVGAVILPALVSLNLEGSAETSLDWVAFGISLLVAASAAVEGFFHFGTHWRHYRETVERLKSEGWSYSQLAGPYHRGGSTHASAFPAFAANVERILGQEVETYVTRIARERDEGKQQE